MSEKMPFYLKKLKEDFAVRVSKNDRFSLRAYARFLEIEAPSLSRILKGHRGIPKAKAADIANRLALSPAERSRFIESNLRNFKLRHIEMPETEVFYLSETHLSLVQEWEHEAILKLLGTKNFQFSLESVAHSLSLSLDRAQACMENLLRERLVTQNGQSFSPVHKNLKYSAGLTAKLENKFACLMTISEDEIEELHELIEEFCELLSRRAQRNPGDAVYKLNVEFKALTK